MRVGFATQLWRGLCAGCLLLGSLCCTAAAAPLGETYFVDFRARPSGYLGHTFIIYGRLDGRGRGVEQHYAGLIPERDVWEGLFVPIYASVRKYKDDGRLTPTSIYRRSVSRDEYQRVGRAVRYLRANERHWHALFYNCNDFGTEIAEAIGLRRPPSLLPPAAWVTLLRKLNEPGN